MSDKKWISNGVEFNVGDAVKVVKKIKTHAASGMGAGTKWENTWTPDMTSAIDGGEFTISRICSNGVWLDGSGDVCGMDFGFPLAALEKIQPKAFKFPGGEFIINDLNGGEFVAEIDCTGGVHLHWDFPLGDSIASTYVDIETAENAVKNGYWFIQNPRWKIIENKLASLREQQDVLISEIMKLEEELAE